MIPHDITVSHFVNVRAQDALRLRAVSPDFSQNSPLD